VKNQGANYSADVSAKIVKNLDEYFDFPYPLSKMDSVAVPVFSAGKLEIRKCCPNTDLEIF
jgi:aminopeptidase N